jgi:tRNA (cytidine/uridine-2'-O-)-methyltransferase
MRLALFEPDIPQNAGALMRLGAGLGIAIDVIEPCGFLFSDRGYRRAGMDYLEKADIVRHSSWLAFAASRQGKPGRLVLLTTHGAVS